MILKRLWLVRKDWLALGVLASGIGLAMIGLLLPVWAVAMWLPLGAPPPSVPELVEVQRGELSAELLDWADVVAVDLPEPARW